jgi:hypothetical protein
MTYIYMYTPVSKRINFKSYKTRKKRHHRRRSLVIRLEGAKTMSLLEERLQAIRTAHTRLQASSITKHSALQYAKSKDGKKLRDEVLMDLVNSDGIRYLGENAALVEELFTLTYQLEVAKYRGKVAQVQYANRITEGEQVNKI